MTGDQLPDVRLWPDGAVSVHGPRVVVVHRDGSGSQPCTQRMVPVGPLRELAHRFLLGARRCQAEADCALLETTRVSRLAAVEAYDHAGDQLLTLLASLTGEQTPATVPPAPGCAPAPR